MISKIFMRKRPVPMRPEPRLEERQMSLREFRGDSSEENVMEVLDVDHIILKRGEGYDEEE